MDEQIERLYAASAIFGMSEFSYITSFAVVFQHVFFGYTTFKLTALALLMSPP